ncbi:MAG: thioesterase family protein [Actinomycetota bacterium]
MPDAFYVPDGDRFIPTEFTRGPWSPDAQHGGPPAALLGRAIEALPHESELRVARFTIEIFRPVPLTPLRLEAHVTHSTRRSQYVEARMSNDEGPIAQASAWRIRAGESDEVAAERTQATLFEATTDLPPFAPPWQPSYFNAVEWRPTDARLLEPGPAAVWMRMRVPLLPGEEPSPLTRVLVVADSGNGISWTLPFTEYLFINTELTVHLARMPEGKWVLLDAETRIGPEGIGLANSILWDERGRLGSGAQSLLVDRR